MKNITSTIFKSISFVAIALSVVIVAQAARTGERAGRNYTSVGLERSFAELRGDVRQTDLFSRNQTRVTRQVTNRLEAIKETGNTRLVRRERQQESRTDTAATRIQERETRETAAVRFNREGRYQGTLCYERIQTV